MNWKLTLGSKANIAFQTILSSSLFPLTRHFVKGRNWIYDAQLFAGTRRLEVAFDVGANKGQTAWGMVRYLKHAQIYCFEPVSSAYDDLLDQYGKFANVHCINRALGANPGTMPIVLHENSELNTLVTNSNQNDDDIKKRRSLQSIRWTTSVLPTKFDILIF